MVVLAALAYTASWATQALFGRAGAHGEDYGPQDDKQPLAGTEGRLQVIRLDMTELLQRWRQAYPWAGYLSLSFLVVWMLCMEVRTVTGERGWVTQRKPNPATVVQVTAAVAVAMRAAMVLVQRLTWVPTLAWRAWQVAECAVHGLTWVVMVQPAWDAGNAGQPFWVLGFTGDLPWLKAGLVLFAGPFWAAQQMRVPCE